MYLYPRSYGVVLWELLTGETPYRDYNHVAIIYGVGTNSLQLPLPPTVPAGFLLLMRMCWDTKPRNRPSFSSILLHLSIASAELVGKDPEIYNREQMNWKKQVRMKMHHMQSTSSSSSVQAGGNANGNETCSSNGKPPIPFTW